MIRCHSFVLTHQSESSNRKNARLCNPTSSSRNVAIQSAKFDIRHDGDEKRHFDPEMLRFPRGLQGPASGRFTRSRSAHALYTRPTGLNAFTFYLALRLIPDLSITARTTTAPTVSSKKRQKMQLDTHADTTFMDYCIIRSFNFLSNWIAFCTYLYIIRKFLLLTTEVGNNLVTCVQLFRLN